MLLTCEVHRQACLGSRSCVMDSSDSYGTMNFRMAARFMSEYRQGAGGGTELSAV